MAYYKKCPNCGANLDPGEKCDCESKAEFNSNITEQDNDNFDYYIRCAMLEMLEMGFCQIEDLEDFVTWFENTQDEILIDIVES